MPELPEVESLRRSLLDLVVGRRVESIRVRESRLREGVDGRALRRDLAGRRCLGISRRAKYLILEFEREARLLVHLGMSGRFFATTEAEPLDRHDHLIFTLDHGGQLRYRDPRRFGLVRSGSARSFARDPRLTELGPEPFDPVFDGTHLAVRARGRRGPVKPFLMDARVVVGVGNIYASEALHRAGIHPARRVDRIAAARWEGLARAVREILAASIERGGTTLADFVDGRGRAGEYATALGVYGREGEPCPVCGAAIRRSVQAARSTYHCPRCQR
ncbi:MAG: bifunctional DNA-formamidopyrimidine glycosylase/DNA-(apurinic or apyrimidinic site) lyase [Planctomycetota bacterium]